MVVKGKPSAITSCTPFPELVKLCFAKSVGFSGVYHSHSKTFTAEKSKDISLIFSLRFIDLVVLMPGFSIAVPFSLPFLFAPSSSSSLA